MDKLSMQAGRLLRLRLWVPHSSCVDGPGTGAGGKWEPCWGWGGGRTALLGLSFCRWAPVCSGVLAEASLAKTGSGHGGVKASKRRVRPRRWAEVRDTGGRPRVGRRNLPQDLISSNPRGAWDSTSSHDRN